VPYRKTIGLSQEKRGGTPDGRAAKVRANSSRFARASNSSRRNLMTPENVTQATMGAPHGNLPTKPSKYSIQSHIEQKSRKGQQHG